jgi:hypothetical protein
MNGCKTALNMACLAAGCGLLFPLFAYGYIDPGTGSYLFQIIIAAFVAVSFAVKVYWHKIKKFIGRLFHNPGK